jgi:hypothetical protein
LEGRSFSDQDIRDSPCVVLVSVSLAHLLWGDYSPLDKKIDLNWGFGSKAFICRVVGVAGNAKDVSLEGSDQPEVYFNFLQRDPGPHVFLIKTKGDSFLSVAEMKDAIQAVDSSQDIHGAEDLASVVNASSYQPRLRATILGSFAGMTFLLAITGVYGLINYSANRKIREIGVRMALGASRANIIWLILRDCLVVVSIGVGSGLVISLAATQLLRTMLYDVKTFDISIYVGTGAFLAVVAMLACLLPAYRASALVPTEVLREG